MELLEINKFANLHDGKQIFFSHIDLCKPVFEEIEKLENEVILITGNHDTPVGKCISEENPEKYEYINYIFDNVPKNVKYWFAQNNVTAKDNIIPLPLGVVNGVGHFRGEHGTGSPISTEYNQMLETVYLHDTSIPERFLYLNYNPRPFHREKATEICQTHLSEYITVNPKNLHYHEFLAHVLNHECVLCPIGVGVDTFRLYETLYCKRIPITINVSHLKDTDYAMDFMDQNIFYQENDYPLYKEIYSQLPVVVLESLEELKDVKHLRKLVDEQKNKEWDPNLLDFNHWKEMIVNLSENLQ